MALRAARVVASAIESRLSWRSAPREFKHAITPEGPLCCAKGMRRAVIARDRGRCALCGRKQWLHIHHIVRKDGDPAGLSLLCDSCHKGLIHAGHVAVSGRAPEIEFRLGDGSPAPSMRALECDREIDADVSKSKPAAAPPRGERRLSDVAVRVLGAIEAGPLHLDELIERLDVPASPVLVAVTEIELAGLARKTGGYVALVGS